MPGISFLFKKRFHPLRMDNQKRLFVAEEKQKSHTDREKELAEQVMKEQEILSYEQLGSAPQDARNSSLRFMYNAPLSATGKERRDGAKLLEVAPPVSLDAQGDDPAVREFKRKLFLAMNPALPQGQQHDDGTNHELVQEEMLLTNGPAPLPRGGRGVEVFVAPSSIPYGEANENQRESVRDDEKEVEVESAIRRVLPQSALEKAVGKRQQPIVTVDEQVERYPFLKNAPVEGSYTKDMQCKHKPFNEIIRNVRCLRCGQWGHQVGDRECALRNLQHPLDYERQQREDPMNRLRDYHSQQLSLSTQEMNENDGDDDLEAAFLKTLTRREKKLLLRKLQLLEGIVPTENNRGSSRRLKDSSKRKTKDKERDSRRSENQRRESKRQKRAKDDLKDNGRSRVDSSDDRSSSGSDSSTSSSSHDSSSSSQSESESDESVDHRVSREKGKSQYANGRSRRSRSCDSHKRGVEGIRREEVSNAEQRNRTHRSGGGSGSGSGSGSVDRSSRDRRPSRDRRDHHR